MEWDRWETVKKKLNFTYAFKIASGAYIVGLEKKHSYFFFYFGNFCRYKNNFLKNIDTEIISFVLESKI